MSVAKVLSVSIFCLMALAACNPAPSSDSIVTSGDSETTAGIIGGVVAKGDEDYAKSVVSLYDVAQGGLCTASILSDSILVTAAHCVGSPASSLRVVFGTSTFATSHIVKAVVSYQVSPLWAARMNEERNAGDIAIVRFSGGLPAGYRPAKVLSDVAALKNGESVLLAGYGISDGIRKGGSGVLRSVEVKIQNSSYTETEVLLDQTARKGACHGDSGGPAYVKVNGQWHLWGVTNRGANDPNDTCGVSAVYASIPAYKNWIVQAANKLLKAQAPPRVVATR